MPYVPSVNISWAKLCSGTHVPWSLFFKMRRKPGSKLESSSRRLFLHTIPHNPQWDTPYEIPMPYIGSNGSITNFVTRKGGFSIFNCRRSHENGKRESNGGKTPFMVNAMLWTLYSIHWCRNRRGATDSVWIKVILPLGDMILKTDPF